MYRGKIIALGTPVELKNMLESQGLLNLESSDPLASMRAIEPEPGILDVAVFGSGLHVTVADPVAAMPRIHQVVAAAGIEVRSLEVISPSMEDVFVARIGEEERRAS
jgi:ABC-2 type transport system ATP-binding protein